MNESHRVSLDELGRRIIMEIAETQYQCWRSKWWLVMDTADRLVGSP